ncbi:MAG: hypothetical protein H5U40_15960 [Polyangiaceae bacterium]|nr:hypothetical protein [Polyangiaceae bacterium]
MNGNLPERDPEAVAEQALERFRVVATTALPLRATLAETLATEAKPTVHALLFATAVERVANPESLEYHETLAMVALLGRSLGLIGGTPTAALRLVPTLLASVREVGWPIPSNLDESLTTVAVEGYVRGREERLVADAAKDAVARIPVIQIAEGCLAVFLRGRYDSEHLTAAMEELGRKLFREEASVCLVVLDGLVDATAGTARAVLSIDEVARTLGVRAIFTGIDERFEEAADRAGLDRTHLFCVGDPAEGVKRALSISGYAVRRVSWLPSPIREWFTQTR